MQLYIDTSKQDEVKITLYKNGKVIMAEVKKAYNHRNQIVLPFIKELLKRHNLKINDLKSIKANPGPGSFTGIRVGIAIANALRYTLGLKDLSIEQIY